MLYDVLPPIVFFGSLGGIILVVSRVMVRLRRQQYASNVETALSQASSQPISKMEDLARVVGPSKKGVHVIKNRISLTQGYLKSVRTRAKEELSSRRAALQSKRRQKTEAKAQAKADKLKARPEPTPSQPVSNKPQTIRHSVKPKPKLALQENTSKKIFSRGPVRKKSALTRAAAAIADAKHNTAEDILVPYIAKHPKNTQAYMLLGKVALVRHDWDEAQEIFEQVIHLNPNTKGAWAYLGQAAFEAGKFTRAIEALRRAHDADPNDANVIRRLIRIAQRMDNAPMQHSLMQELKILTKARQKSAKRQAVQAR